MERIVIIGREGVGKEISPIENTLQEISIAIERPIRLFTTWTTGTYEYISGAHTHKIIETSDVVKKMLSLLSPYNASYVINS